MNTSGNLRLMAAMFKAEAAEVTVLRAALRELAGAAVTDCDGSGRPFEPGEFHEHVLRVAVEALGDAECGDRGDGLCKCSDAEPDADGGFNGEPLGDVFDDAHSDGETDPNYCEECDGPCELAHQYL